MTNDVLKVRLAKTLPDYMFIREVRNSCYLNMTRDRRKIGLFEQLRFFFFARKKFFIFILSGDSRIGYVLIRKSDSGFYFSFAIREEFRGLGFGTFLVKTFKENYYPLVAEVLKTNVASRRVFEKEGFFFHLNLPILLS